ncbi:MAG: aldehyde-activating protein, partial [Candidatus Binataceae bacterium]
LLTTSDPQGEMDFAVADNAAMLRYRFDTATADFLMCGRCGVYVGAQMKEAGRYYGIANLRTLEGGGELEVAQAMDYSAENAGSRRARRVSRWTPVRTPV